MSHIAVFVAGIGCGFITAAAVAAHIVGKRDTVSMKTHRAAMAALAKATKPVSKP